MVDECHDGKIERAQPEKREQDRQYVKDYCVPSRQFAVAAVDPETADQIDCDDCDCRQKQQCRAKNTDPRRDGTDAEQHGNHRNPKAGLILSILGIKRGIVRTKGRLGIRGCGKHNKR